MQYMFYLVSFMGLLYLLVGERKLDFFSIAYFSAIIYFLPGYFGYVIEPNLVNGKIIMTNTPINGQVYVVMTTVLLCISIFALLNDYFFTKIENKSVIFSKNIKEAIYIPHVLFVFSLILIIFTFIKMGGNLFAAKTVAWENLGITHILWRVTISFLFVQGILIKNRWLTLYSFLLLVLFFLMGSRSVIALSIIAIIMFLLYEKGCRRLITSFRVIPTLIIILFGMTMFIGKRIYGGFQSNGLSGIWETVTDFEIYIKSITNSEPFAIQMILNTVITNDYYLGFKHLSDLPLQLLIVPSFFSDEISNFSIEFTNTFYGFVNYGMAYNIWAEAYAVGKWPLLIFTIILYNIILLFLNKLLKVKDNYLKSLILLLGVYWAFYIHRNSVYTIMALERYNIMMFLLALIISFYLFIIINKHEIESSRCGSND